MTARFPVVVFDFDHTLFDFEASKRIAFQAVVEATGIPQRPDHLTTFAAGEKPLWRELEQGSRTLDSLNDARFAALVAHSDIDGDPAAMGEQYLLELGRNGDLLPGARGLLDALHGQCRMAMASNGYDVVQQARLDNFDLRKYFDVVVVSSVVGHAKPDVRFFDWLFDALTHDGERPEVTDTLMVGDSLTSDMAGALNYGMPTCWFNPTVSPLPDTHPVDWVVHDLAEVLTIVNA